MQQIKIFIFFPFVTYIVTSFLLSNAIAIDNPNSTDLIIEGEILENTIDKQLKATGDAVLIKSGKKIQADTIIYDQVSNKLKANGNVRLNAGATLITGDELSLDVDNSVGEIPNATFDSDTENKSSINQSIRGFASKLFMDGENKTKLSGAEITTCEVGKTDWFIKGSEIEIDNKTKSVDATNARMTSNRRRPNLKRFF
jgi:LPS-assembly protein